MQNEPRQTEPLDALLRIVGNENKLRKVGGTPYQYTIRMWPRMRRRRRKTGAHDFRMVRARHVMIRGTREKSTTEMPKKELQENRRNIKGCANGPRWQRWEFSLPFSLTLSLYCVSVKTIFTTWSWDYIVSVRGRGQGHGRGRSRQRLLVVCLESNKHFYDLIGMIFTYPGRGYIHFRQSL